MKRLLLTLCALCTLFSSFAQMKEKKSPVAIFVGDSAWNMVAVSTMSEVTNGWSVQGVEVKKAKITRYLNKTQALQQTSETQPKFVFTIEEGTLNDYALIELSVKKNYRKFSSSELARCRYTRISPEEFCITPVEDNKFVVQPLKPLKKGEYVWVNLKQPPVNTYGDVMVFDFSVQNNFDL